MGNCVLVHKSTDPAMQFGPRVAEPGFDQNLSSASAGEDQEDTSPESSKSEMFFDSQAWLDSDTEDYFSINGDFTPSRGNTPIHPKSFVGNSLHDKTLTRDSESNAVPQPPTTDMNKQLSELFCESFRYDTMRARELEDVAKAEDINFPDISTIRSPYTAIQDPVCSSEPTPNRGGYLPKKDNSSQSAQCCFPSFVRSLSFRERKKRPSAVESSAW